MNHNENNQELEKSERIGLGITGAFLGLVSFIPFIFVSWYLSDRLAELLDIDYGIDPSEELLIYVCFIIPLIFLCSYCGIKLGKLFYKYNNTVIVNRYLGAYIGAILGGILVSFIFSLLVVAICYYT
jgi:uncharacterized membrane protein required for colicin V production